jgi:hypothetical protein
VRVHASARRRIPLHLRERQLDRIKVRPVGRQVDELAREKKHRLDPWMSNGGDPESFERAWPSMMQAIMEESYRSRQERAEDLFA